MTIGQTIAAAGFTALCLASAPALADTIDFGQFGPEGTNLSTPLRGVTVGGVGFTLVAPGPLFRDNEGSLFLGDMPSGTPTLFENTPGQIVIYFDTPLASIGTLYVEPDFYEAYTGTLSAYDHSGVLLGSVSDYRTLTYNPGSDGGLEIIGAGIDHITLYTSDQMHGFNVGGAGAPGVPEPASWALMLLGAGLLGGRMRARSRAIANEAPDPAD